MARRYESWGRYPQVRHRGVLPLHWRHELPDLGGLDAPVLPYGQGRSYGDVCLNEGGYLLDVAPLNRFLAFDPETGVLRCEAGVTLDQILKLVVPRGWFLPVTPGTKFITVGGAIANDVHGKNHHRAGTFGRHVLRFELLRSDGRRLLCSPQENADLFRATVGGLGLTGVILWAEIQLIRIPSSWMVVERVPFRNLDEFFEVSARSDEAFEYTVAWIDCLARGPNLGRGIFLRGNHAEAPRSLEVHRDPHLVVPVDLPSFVLNPWSMRAFNALYYRLQSRKAGRRLEHYEPFFYPLDAIHRWNRIYGRRGFLQYQCVLPREVQREGIREILTRIARSGNASFLAVLKEFGDVPSPGLLSFPRPGVTLALDLPFTGPATLGLLDDLDRLVLEAGGALYPAKDARMAPEVFRASYPALEAFLPHRDPAFSSSFWRRVSQPAEGGAP